MVEVLDFFFFSYYNDKKQKGGDTMACKEDFIAVFDSGVGGISVLKELISLMPGENYLYFGDSANAPYGRKTTEEVRLLTLKNAEMLLQRGVKALVVACNTATSAAIDVLRETFPDAIILGIEPALKPAITRFPTGSIGIMATDVTLREKKLQQLIDRFDAAQVERISAPGLVELIEQGKADSQEAESFLRLVLAPYVGKLDALVLGCTHYPFVKNTISKILGEDTLLFDGSAGTARQARRCLEEAGLLLDGEGSVTIENSLGTSKLLELSYHLLEK